MGLSVGKSSPVREELFFGGGSKPGTNRRFGRSSHMLKGKPMSSDQSAISSAIMARRVPAIWPDSSPKAGPKDDPSGIQPDDIPFEIPDDIPSEIPPENLPEIPDEISPGDLPQPPQLPPESRLCPLARNASSPHPF
jgi:hypothetical protein